MYPLCSHLFNQSLSVCPFVCLHSTIKWIISANFYFILSEFVTISREIHFFSIIWKVHEYFKCTLFHHCMENKCKVGKVLTYFLEYEEYAYGLKFTIILYIIDNRCQEKYTRIFYNRELVLFFLKFWKCALILHIVVKNCILLHYPLYRHILL